MTKKKLPTIVSFARKAKLPLFAKTDKSKSYRHDFNSHARGVMKLRGKVKTLTLKNSSGESAFYEFDTQGKILRFSDSTSEETNYFYDKLDRVIKIRSQLQESNFLYGTHRKYIDLFWCDELPRFIQGLEMAIEKTESGSTVWVWKIHGEQGEIIETENGIPYSQGKIYFEGAFPREIRYAENHTVRYTFDKKQNRLLQWEEQKGEVKHIIRFRDNPYNLPESEIS